MKQILQPNSSRKQIIISNPAVTSLYIDFTADVSAASYAYVLYKGQTQIIDFEWAGGVWVFARGAGNIEVRELTAA